MALPMYGRANRPTRRYWLEAATLLGLPERAMRATLDKIVAGSHTWVNRLAEIGFDDEGTRRLRKLVEVRRDEITG